MFADFHDSWWFLVHHHEFYDPKSKELWPDIDEEMQPYFWSGFTKSLDIDVRKVNPQSREIDDDVMLNTHTEVWLECGAFVPFTETEYTPSHDIDLDCGGDTFEEAIINLANLVLEKYGDYRNEKSKS